MTDRSELENSFFLRQFYEFYSEVIVQKKIAESYAKRSLMAGGGAMSSETETIHPIHMTLLNLLDRQVLEARRHGGEYGVTFYKEAQYVMAALADDIFLHIDWDGRENWKSDLLEFKLFGTYTAGEIFFRNLEKLLKDRDPGYMEIAAVYFLAISLGFRGKFRDKDDGGQIANYRRQLFAFIFQKDPDLLAESRKLFPDTYAHILSQAEGKKLPYLKWWIGLIVLLIILFLIISYGIWTDLTEDLIDIAEDILR
ncbi:DotU family type IV/VI secretion system protein [Desulfonema magnum]|uniref:Type VI secretion system protein, DotU-like n=1 Tax=Desulfonema magnum TaxID=45655 RepID=A0A975GME8_9BACT|nr:DotU family type IV/VI secretion system protein [Desulfonema magnum]QTA85768.1 Type VI secretion system protein, DotU-like [Desulfonema magnum]